MFWIILFFIQKAEINQSQNKNEFILEVNLGTLQYLRNSWQ